jgi:hypothetical protein
MDCFHKQQASSSQPSDKYGRQREYQHANSAGIMLKAAHLPVQQFAVSVIHVVSSTQPLAAKTRCLTLRFEAGAWRNSGMASVPAMYLAIFRCGRRAGRLSHI